MNRDPSPLPEEPNTLLGLVRKSHLSGFLIMTGKCRCALKVDFMDSELIGQSNLGGFSTLYFGYPR